ncbi:TRAP transporter substrate-binding protein DctP, partial [Variovorax sp. PvP013]|uniref:TRAP transporter substrate-binding protein DctP n=1 Tax=Variovorax sp. PvP013 TaxID=3156435 RepID=UPI003D19B2FC
MKKTLRALTALAASIPLWGGATEFRSADIHPDDYPTVTAVKFMGERLKALSGGKHTIKVFNNSSLGQEKDTIEQTKIGALQMVRVNIAPMNNICAETQVPTMPFLFRSVDHLHKVL